MQNLNQLDRVWDYAVKPGAYLDANWPAFGRVTRILDSFIRTVPHFSF